MYCFCRKKIAVILSLFLFPFLCAGCKQRSIKITSWNVQTFFDSVTCGTEYSQFKDSKSGWNLEVYNKRLLNLCKSIEILDSDILILEEIENKGIVYDISNELARNSFNNKKIYHYGTFSKKEDASIGCAVLSRYPVTNLKVHDLDIGTEDDKNPSMRTVMEVHFLAEEMPMVIFINHWKSKSDGEEKSAKWRQWQESVLCRNIRLQKKDLLWIATGDFNMEFGEFIRDDNCLLLGISDFLSDESEDGSSENTELKTAVYNPWADFYGQTGSYWFKNKWERIDHFFVKAPQVIESFVPESQGPWADGNGRPAAFRLYKKEGYSDHLPVSVTVKRS